MNNFLNSAVYLDDIPFDQWKNYIGNGYRSCVYMQDAEKNGRIILFGFDKEGNPKTFICPHKSHLCYNVKFKTPDVDIYGHYVATKWFKNKYERDIYVKNANGLNIVECYKPEQEFLHKLFDKDSFNESFNKQKIRIHYLDIETEMSESFEKPSDARNRINMLTIYDSKTEKFYTWSLEHAEIDFNEDPLKDYPKDKFVLFEFHNDEIAMLEHFISWLEDNYADVVYGWNIKAYDIPYVTRRIENVLGKNEARRLSPVGKYFIKEVNHDNERADVSAEIEVTIAGLFIADGLILYRDKFMISHPDGGYTLDNIGEIEGCGHKIHYNGTLKDLYIKDWQKFYEYNVRDVDLCKRIDDKCKMINQARTVTSCGVSDYNTIYGSISYLISSVTAFAKVQMNGKIFNSYVAEKKNFPPFEGAFVFPTIPGVYRGGIGTIDFASLYPSIIRSINISPETYVGKVLIHYYDDMGIETAPDLDHEPAFNIHDDTIAKSKKVASYSLMLPNGKRKKIDLEWLRNIVKDKCIYSANNTLFLKHEVKTGIIPLWCKFYYTNRKATKKKMLAIYHQLHNEEIKSKMSEVEIFEAETKMENYNSLQLAYKSMINSIYGCMGNGFSSLANPHLAQSITRTGKFCNTSTQAYVRKLFERLYNIDSSYVPVCGMDTDSIFINLKCITDEMSKRWNLGTKVREWPKKYKRVLWNYTSMLVEKEINPYVRNLIHNYCGTSKQDILTYELEYMSSDAVYESKKHYFAHLIFNEGDFVNYNKVTGIELKKTILAKEMKSFIADIYDGIVNKYWTEADYQQYVNELYNKFKQFKIDEIAFWKGYNTERQAVGFLSMQIGTTGVAKACIYHNQLLEKLRISKKYETIEVGNKVRLCYLNPSNQYGIDVIAFKPGAWPKEFDEIFEIDYHKMFEKIILDPLKRLREACKFSTHDPSKQVECDIFSL